MSIKKIKEFYKVSSNFLRNNQSDEMIGIPYLNPHIPRTISYNNNINFNFLTKVFNYLVRLIFFNKNYNFCLKKKFKYIILSHFVSYDHLNYKNDFYFGNLAEKLGKNNVLFILIDHIGLNKKKLGNSIKGNYIILSKSSGFYDEIKMFSVTFFKVLYYQIFNHKLKLFSINNIIGSVENQRIQLKIKKIFKQFYFDKFFFTFEGNPYEKLVCKEVNNLNRKTCCIGYQFSVLRKFQHSIYQNINKKFNPNIVFTFGNYNKKLLISKFQKRIKVYNIGYLKFKKNNFLKKKKIKNKKIKILVMPEGIPGEIELFINFCLKNCHKEVIYNLRMHPIFKRNILINKMINEKRQNIKTSNNNLDYDFKNNDIILYRGTAAVLDAIKFNLIPLYLKNKDEVSVDPLFQLNKQHILKNGEELLNIIDKVLTKKKYLNEQKKMKQFAQNFYQPANFKKVFKILKYN